MMILHYFYLIKVSFLLPVQNITILVIKFLSIGSFIFNNYFSSLLHFTNIIFVIIVFFEHMSFMRYV